MKGTLSALIMICCIVASIARAGDLYLLGINDKDELDAAREIVGHAHGIFNGQFLVDLNPEQEKELKQRGLKALMILPGYGGQRLFKTNLLISGQPVISPDVEIVCSVGKEYLIRPGKNEMERMRKDGYELIPVDNTETPLFYNPPANLTRGASMCDLDSVAAWVNQDSLYSYVARMQAFRSRCIYSDSFPAVTNWIVNKFREFGYDTVYTEYADGVDEWTGGMVSGRNVICIKPGKIQPARYLLVGAHFDSYTHYPVADYENAPGADDNGSGMAAVLEMARIMKDLDLNYSIIFAPFWGEEEGLLGSHYLANSYYSQGMPIEHVLGLDVISYKPNDGVDTIYTSYPPMADVFDRVYMEAASRITQTVCIRAGECVSDDCSFENIGYLSTGFCEYHYNLNMHHANDSTTYINFPYLTNNTRFMAAAFAAIARATFSPNFTLSDYGDGQKVRIQIGDYHPEWTYKAVYGTSSGVYTDTAVIPPQTSSYDLSGLTDGQRYYMGLMAMEDGGCTSLHIIENSIIPRSVPMAPSLVSVIPDSLSVNVTWRKNKELDIKEYHVVRSLDLVNWNIAAAVVSDTTYHDVDVVPHTIFYYKIITVDNDLNESDSSGLNQATPATFDWPLLFVDETGKGGNNPTEAMQDAFYSSALSGFTFTKMKVDSSNQLPTRCDMGQYKSIFWIDDDNLAHYFNGDVYAADWYLKYSTNWLLAGWKTVQTITGSGYLYSGNFFYDHLGLSRVGLNASAQFVGANGDGDWPDLELRPDEPFLGILPDITVFEPAAYGEVIYRYRSLVPGSYYDGKPVGIAYNSGFGKRVVLGFPLYYLDEASAQILVQKVTAYFAEETPRYGDADNDGRTNIKDITYLINYLYRDGPPPVILNNADVNGDCKINIKDISYLIRYLYQSGPTPVEGCID